MGSAPSPGSAPGRQRLADLLAGRLGDPDELFAGLTAQTDEAFLEWLTAYAVKTTGQAFSFVGEVRGADNDRVRTVALQTAAGSGEPFEYDLRGTPCSEVLEQSLCVFPQGVCALFPDDTMLVDMGVESYAGVALHDLSGHPLGLFAVLGTQPLSDAEVATVGALLEAFRARTETVLLHRRALREYQWIQQRLDPTAQEQTLAELTQGLARSLHVKAAFVASFADVDRTRLRTLAYCVGGVPVDNVEYPVAGSAAERLGDRDSLLLPRGARDAFPDDAELQRLEADGYFALALRDTQGAPIGHLGVLHDRPLADNIRSTPLFNLCAERVAFEIQRKIVEQERLETERRMLEVQRAESLGILAGGIAHDFNNLLVSILGNADLTLAELADDTPARELVDEIINASEKAAGLCRQMLAYAGRAQLIPTRFELQDKAKEISQLLRASLPPSCELSLSLDAPPLWLDGDPTQFNQVVLNLITNAAEAVGSATGTIAVTAGTRQLQAADLPALQPAGTLQPGQVAFLRVSDTGCGMDALTRQRIFDPFFTTKQDGHGLGLAAMLGIVGAHGGGVRVDSQPGEGSVFTVYFPLSQAPESERDTPASETRHIASVLVVDDEEQVRTVAGRMLQRAGFSVTYAADGAEALQTYRARPGGFDCVLLDLSMPRMGGAETFAGLVALDAGVRVVLSTGFGDAAELGEVDGRRPAGAVSKPYRMQDLVAVVSDACRAAP